jgi:hypothetical protein
MRPAPHVRARVTPDGVLLLNTQTGAIMSANRVGARVWELLAEGQDNTRIAARIAQEFAAPPPTVSTDVDEFLAELQQHHLVEER